MGAPLFELRRLLPNSCPAVNPQNWETLRLKGWRFECNFCLQDIEAAMSLVKEYQASHGDEYVTIGSYYDQDESVNGPASLPSWFGLYLWEDVNDLADKLNTALDDLEALNEWLSKPKEKS